MVVNIILEIATLTAANAVGVVIHDEICKGSKKARTRVRVSLFAKTTEGSVGTFIYHWGRIRITWIPIAVDTLFNTNIQVII